MDFMKRLLIAAGVAVCITLLFFGAQISHANEINTFEKLNWIWPTEGVISDTFGTRGGKHHGIDIAAESGTPVHAVERGEVRRSYYSNSYGNVVFLTHPNGMETVYAHLQNRSVDEGEFVEQGEKIGEVGNTGRSNGSHLHLEVHNGAWDRDKSLAIDPMRVLKHDETEQFVHHGDATIASVHSDPHKKENHEDKGNMRIVDIEKGDTLWAFSQQFDVTVSDLQEWNDLDSSLIIAGEQLIVYVNESV